MKTIKIVGILNTTPDSYFDGGRYDASESAVNRAIDMQKHGADIIEIGGQSTGPGSSDISIDEELSRTIPIIKAMKESLPDAQLSIDTYMADVAREAIFAGVSMVNDVTAGRGDSQLFSVVAQAEIPIVLMYAKDSTARTTVDRTEYKDVIATIQDFLESRIEAAIKQGIKTSSIIIDPGLGHFLSADPEYSFEVIRRLSELTTLAPVFISPSRKSFLSGHENLPPKDRLPATIAASIACVSSGAEYIRTHDVLDTFRALQTHRSIQESL